MILGAKMMSAAAATSPSELGVHFTVPEGTTFISDIHPEDEVGEGEGGEDGYSSWKAWGVGKKTVMSATIPSSVTTIGRNAFWGCKLLVNVTIPPFGNQHRRECFRRMQLINER